MDITSTPQELSATAAIVWTWGVEYAPRLFGAAVTMLVGVLVAKWAGRAIARLPRGVSVDETFRPVIAATIRYGITILVVVAALGQLGVQTASVLAVLGAAGLAIGLALQGTLSNIAAGVMLLWLRPFRVGEYVETPVAAGIVREVGLFATRLDSFDGLYRFVPNQAIWNQPLINHSRNRGRMVNLSVGVPLDTDLDKACGIIRGLLGEDQRIMPSPAAEVFVDTMADDFVYIGVRAWLPSAGFWSGHRDLVAEIKKRLNAAGISIRRMLHAAADVGDGSPIPATLGK